jgi:cytochrome P450
MASAKYPPGPTDGLLGVTFHRTLQANPLRFAVDVARQYGDFAYVRLAWVQLYFVNRPELIREVLVTKMKSFRRLPRQMRALSKVEGNGLVVAEGEPWARHRPVVQNAFHARYFEKYAATIVEHTVRRMDGWRPGRPFDLGPEMNELALEIISKLVFGEDWSRQASELRESIQTIRQSMVREATASIVLPDWLPLPSKLRLKRALAVISEQVWKRIRERRESNAARDDMLALMLDNAAALKASPPIRDAEIRDEAATLFIAGHDTTSASMAWLWYALATNPEVERRAIEEVDAVLGARAPGFADYPRLKYIELVVKESMRKHPAAGFLFGRQAIEPVELGGYTIPKGAWIMMSPHIVQNDARHFPNPQVFDPQRFAPGRIEQIPPYAYIPFGGGPRICMGNSLALLEMTLLAATVLRRYRLVMLPGQCVEPEIEVVARPKGALMVYAEPRVAATRKAA